MSRRLQVEGHREQPSRCGPSIPSAKPSEHPLCPGQPRLQGAPCWCWGWTRDPWSRDPTAALPGSSPKPVRVSVYPSRSTSRSRSGSSRRGPCGSTSCSSAVPWSTCTPAGSCTAVRAGGRGTQPSPRLLPAARDSLRRATALYPQPVGGQHLACPYSVREWEREASGLTAPWTLCPCQGPPQGDSTKCHVVTGTSGTGAMLNT